MLNDQVRLMDYLIGVATWSRESAKQVVDYIHYQDSNNWRVFPGGIKATSETRERVREHWTTVEDVLAVTQRY